MNDIEFVSNRTFDNYAKRIERKNMEQNGQSLTYSGIARRANPFIVDIQTDRKGMLVKVGWREAMKQETAP